MDAQTVVRRAGGPARVAKMFQISLPAVMKWTEIPADHLPELVLVTGLSHSDIRPDLYPVEIWGEEF